MAAHTFPYLLTPPRSLLFIPLAVPALALCGTLFSKPGHGAEFERGRMLYKNHCQECHTSVVHVRDNQEAQSREDIRFQVRRWQEELGLGWGAEEVEDVSYYLNQRYYGFGADTVSQ